MSQQKNAHYFLPRAFEKKQEREGIEYKVERKRDLKLN